MVTSGEQSVSDSVFDDKVKELQEQRESLAAEMRSLNDNSEDWGAEEQQKWDKLHEQYESCKRELDAEVGRQTRKKELDQIAEHRDMIRSAAKTEIGERRIERLEDAYGGAITNETRNWALRGWALGKYANRREKEAAERCGYTERNYTHDIPNMPGLELPCFLSEVPRIPVDVRHPVEWYKRWITEQRQQATTPGTAGGYTVPDEMMRSIEVARMMFGTIRRVATILRTTTGADLPWPKISDVNNKGQRIAENAPHGQTDLVFDQTVLKAYTYSSDIVLFSFQLLQDTATNMNTLLGDLLGERVGRIEQEEFTTGVGPVGTMPIGITQGSADSGVTLATANAPTFDEWIDIKHSVDPAYRREGGGMGMYMFHDEVLKNLKKLKDAEGRPLWQSGLAANAPDTVDGDRYELNQEMPTAAAGRCIVYGDLSKQIIRDVMGFTLRRTDDRYWENAQIGFMGLTRSDSQTLDAGGNPIKYASNGP